MRYRRKLLVVVLSITGLLSTAFAAPAERTSKADAASSDFSCLGGLRRLRRRCCLIAAHFLFPNSTPCTAMSASIFNWTTQVLWCLVIQLQSHTSFPNHPNIGVAPDGPDGVDVTTTPSSPDDCSISREQVGYSTVRTHCFLLVIEASFL